MTKDRAFIAAGKYLEHFKDMRGHAKTKFLDDNFKTVWSKHDDQHHNYLMQSDAESFLDELTEPDGPSDQQNVETEQEDQ